MEIIPGRLFFTQTSKSIFGEVVEGSEVSFLGFIIRKRIIPKLDKNHQPTDETYEMWETCRGNHSWFSDSFFYAQMKAIELQ